MSPPLRNAGAAIVLSGVVTLLSCASASPPQSGETARHTAPGEALAWEQKTRERSDQLLDEADRRLNRGDIEQALDCTDHALALVLDTPPGYQAEGPYMDYLSDVLEQAQSLEDRLAQSLVPTGTETPPPLELVDEVQTTEPVHAEDEPEITADESSWQLAMTANSHVQRFLEAFTEPGELNTRIQRGLARCGLHISWIRSRFEDAGVPRELAYLPIIESGFSNAARSRAGAQGMWQFMPSTGRRYGLRVTTLVDERRDPELATNAALAYLIDLHAEFGDWYLALAAYNSGSGRVRRGIRRAGSSDFWDIRRYLPRETRNYVPAFLASVFVAKDPEAYGFDPIVEEPLRWEAIEVPDALDLDLLADKLQVSSEALRDLNPALRYGLTPAGRTSWIRVPDGLGDSARTVLDETPRSEWAPKLIHVVRRGDSLYEIARRYGSSVSAIRQASSLRGSLIHPGQRLVVPRGRGGSSWAARRTASDGTYRVKRGDTLWEIARSFRTTVSALAQANGISVRAPIHPGQRLAVPGGDTGGGTASSEAIYTIVRGDTLSQIAQRFGVSLWSLKTANGLRGSRIHPGQQLRIPGLAPKISDDSYRVRRGDTLYDIARRFGVSVGMLKRANGLVSNTIHPGQTLHIPSGSARG